MGRIVRPLMYGFVGAAIFLAVFASPAAWATPSQNPLAQTIPTRTPTPAQIQPTELPPATPVIATRVPGSTAGPGSPTAPPVSAPAAGSTATPNTACAGQASLTLVAEPKAVWPGATVVFTATLTNTGRQPLRQVVLEAQLPTGLEPGLGHFGWRRLAGAEVSGNGSHAQPWVETRRGLLGPLGLDPARAVRSARAPVPRARGVR